MSSLRITTHGTKQATSKDLRVIKVQKVRKDLKVRMELKVYQVVTDVMVATVKMY